MQAAHEAGQTFVSVGSLYAQRTGLTVALQDYMDKKTDELALLRTLLTDFQDWGRGAHARRAARPKKTAATIVESGNDYVLQAKGNQSKLRARLVAWHQADPCLAQASSRVQEHRRGVTCTWQTRVYPCAAAKLVAAWHGWWLWSRPCSRPST